MKPTLEIRQLKHILRQRLARKGIEETFFPGFLRLLENALCLYPRMDLRQVNRKLNYLGWQDLELASIPSSWPSPCSRPKPCDDPGRGGPISAELFLRRETVEVYGGK